MATKSYKWFFDLTENLLTKDVTNDYIATVKTLLPKTVDNLADDIVKETAYNRETVIGVITLYDKKIIESVCQGTTGGLWDQWKATPSTPARRSTHRPCPARSSGRTAWWTAPSTNRM